MRLFLSTYSTIVSIDYSIIVWCLLKIKNYSLIENLFYLVNPIGQNRQKKNSLKECVFLN